MACLLLVDFPPAVSPFLKRPIFFVFPSIFVSKSLFLFSYRASLNSQHVFQLPRIF
ncbi:uncharacterized protein BDW47DRAFT_102886 [Aspergillus candidus]|uniref:Uncharacterized protein n=1 Tax=Aspergillus candidus TaxID=41067 RepID=A0A2I2FGC0_ASPCN|nr:hypothetical protein BDW47DRAFT_102886 [Aspergillus candidus]PLB39671.1 hypothetical protein BDW47DRAFT_102886 [Aspergillus candidus]